MTLHVPAIDDADLAAKFEAYALKQWPEFDLISVTGMKRIHGGASRQTYNIDLSCKRGDETESLGVILRRDPEASLINTEREIEFAAFRSMTAAGIPIPCALFLETDKSALGAPFFVMERIDVGIPGNPFQPGAFGEHQRVIGEQFFEHLGKIAKVDPAGTPISEVAETPAPEAAWSKELAYWENEIDQHELEPQPIVRAAIRYLKANPPPPAQKLSIVHGDYRTGNFLHDEAGVITAILDWEMAHIGDPYEDRAWATDPLWSLGDEENAAALLPWAEAIAIWQKHSGCDFDPAAFAWWSLFSSVKGMGIWVTSAHTWNEGKNPDPILAWSGWFTTAAHNLILAHRLTALKGIST